VKLTDADNWWPMFLAGGAFGLIRLGFDPLALYDLWDDLLDLLAGFGGRKYRRRPL
jgi:hypothetical protein